MNPVIVYQMGKVGSSTLKKSLEENNIPALHIHRFFFTDLERPMKLKLLPHKLKNRSTFNKFLKGEKVKIITFYRDPLSRNISSFFQNLDVYFKRSELKNLDYSILEERFNKAHKIHNTPNNWFDLEFNKRLGINIFNFPFEKEKGYSIINKDNIQVFLCVTDKINHLEKELGGFLEIQDFKLNNSNIGDKKWYKDLYKEFKNKYKPTHQMLDKLYDSNIIKHFYNKEEIFDMKKPWL
ncbi:putative capsular polysaccharide synthesis family protein [Hanstruepera marina]|uniref:putative capsular polysaccharide synthesis family protein n=1 Tax=Hanstruepera marina TaxID=2873265 RepID=UPI001CA6A751|nr:putative capsular polysaccharide synthesis family protein [Hanstruepera marina]